MLSLLWLMIGFGAAMAALDEKDESMPPAVIVILVCLAFWPVILSWIVFSNLGRDAR